ncbi:MAG: RNA polymerase subunit sigma [Candidatus Dactylopiibacterium carminicum]|uniref:RNA polymerase subunit sigma n=1 Tax=Candidatus Dactylopiibacterium carminicum TaxID=857335 RepID=A0A272ENZ7_9RHOO|nr:sigma-70 family RNA polymerase sigma factor [Candidatus Dactylopiibacterium carminicum]KAF7598190.1 RNA polymerase subunit sigma [Candidatus Dactylopiibacterium carminicum]PAS91842.1 MAG: RNA polymerase subunit sigma [Candidatus Dactylopiibacterium carminicum]PAS94613.1 MAG: RNA polymerase subunit sigma [Candidatus Dactylopiibacterium carminicum]PAS96908.1 MAG: RNA polymerase subunit sigma [Candidatus Dactylopiibacterium carminicum]
MSTTAPTDSLAALYADNHSWLQAWLRKKLNCSHRAADLTQDTFLRLLVSGRLPEPEFSRAYLTQIAKGLMVDQFRRRQIELAYLDALAQLPEVQAPSPETQALVIETLSFLDTALNRLPVPVRETFLLSQFDGLTYRTIAERLGIAPATVRKYMLRATLACYAALEETSQKPKHL